jgi:ketosteroid isomerase-like protein
MKRWFSFVAVWLLLLPGLLKSQTPSEDDEATVRRCSADFIVAFNNLDWEKFRVFFDDNATIFHPAQFPRRLVGRSEYEKAWLDVFAGIRTGSGRSKPPYMELRPEDMEVQLLNDVAIVTFHLNRGHNSIGRRTLVWRKSSQEWRIIHLHASNLELAAGGP